jgi:hypothetical protein
MFNSVTFEWASLLLNNITGMLCVNTANQITQHERQPYANISLTEVLRSHCGENVDVGSLGCDAV